MLVEVNDLRNAAAVLGLTGVGGQVAALNYLRVAQLLGHGTYTVMPNMYGDRIEDDRTQPEPLPG